MRCLLFFHAAQLFFFPPSGSLHPPCIIRHSFCRECASNEKAACPHDGCLLQSSTSMAPLLLVPNLTLEAQVADLQVFCRHAVFQPSTAQPSLAHVCAMDLNPSGCTAVVRLGELTEHEGLCPFASLPCRFNPTCGLFSRAHLGAHLIKCPRVPCRNKVIEMQKGKYEGREQGFGKR